MLIKKALLLEFVKMLDSLEGMNEIKKNQVLKCGTEIEIKVRIKKKSKLLLVKNG